MTRRTHVLAFLFCLVSSLLVAPTAAAAEPTFPTDARVTLDACRTAVEARIEGVLTATRALAATEQVRSGDWGRMRGPLEVMAGGVKENAAVWFARSDGSYFSVEKGLTGESL